MLRFLHKFLWGEFMRTLIVESDSGLRDIYRNFFESQNVDVFEAGTVSEAVHNLERVNDIELVINDVAMGDGAGMKVLDFWKNQNNSSSMIISSEQHKLKNMDLASFGDDFLFERMIPKPIQTISLEFLLRFFLERKTQLSTDEIIAEVKSIIADERRGEKEKQKSYEFLNKHSSNKLFLQALEYILRNNEYEVTDLLMVCAKKARISWKDY